MHNTNVAISLLINQSYDELMRECFQMMMTRAQTLDAIIAQTQHWKTEADEASAKALLRLKDWFPDGA